MVDVPTPAEESLAPSSDLRVPPHVRVAANALHWRAVRSSGPGGQNVNKVSTKAELRVSLADLEGLDGESAARLRKLAGTKLTLAGELVLVSSRTRDLKRNQADALEKLTEMLKQAQERPKPRRATRPSKGSKERRLAGKRQQSARKQTRGAVRDDS